MAADSTEPTKPPRLPPRWFIRAAWALHRAVVALTGGRLGIRGPRGNSYGSLRLHTIGRHSGKERVAMLGYKMDGPNLVTVAMNGWADPEPQWWLNLQAHPEAIVDLEDGSLR